jgi:CDP-glucose 4,6-dehydratase
MINFYKNKNIIITGHTGFKGSWLTLMLILSGANVFGYSLKPKKLSLFNCLKLNEKLSENKFSDIRNYNKLEKFIINSKPDIIFHLAAQPIVSEGYLKPLYTWNVNVGGTLNLLKVTGKLKKKCSVVIITTDKVYKDSGKKKYSEDSELEGKDPYSLSKVAVENLTDSWRTLNNNKKIKITVARAGNVIGGGDWSKNRLIPDLVKNIIKKKITHIRRPESIRPWQYVLKVLEGYMILAKKNYLSNTNKYDCAYNFGPKISECKKVKTVVGEFTKNWKTKIIYKSNIKKFQETDYLFLNSKKAKIELKWLSSYTLKETIKKTCDWYRIFYFDKKSIYKHSIKEIKDCLKL